MKRFIVPLLLMPVSGIGDAAVELDELNAMGLIGPQSSKIQAVAVNCQRHFHGQHKQSNVITACPVMHRQRDVCGGMTFGTG